LRGNRSAENGASDPVWLATLNSLTRIIDNYFEQQQDKLSKFVSQDEEVHKLY